MRLSRTGVRLTPSAAASSFSDSAAPGGSSSVSTFRRRVSYTTRRLVRGRTTAAMSFIVVHNTVELVWQSLDLLLDRCLYTSTAGQALEQSRECDPWTTIERAEVFVAGPGRNFVTLRITTSD